MNKESRLKQVRIENFIFFIYLGIIFLSFYSNHLEVDYLKNNNKESKEKYRYTLILIFSIALVVYIYYAYDSYQSLKEKNQSSETKYLNNLSFIASILILISGIIFLYIAYSDREVSVELAFS